MRTEFGISVGVVPWLTEDGATEDAELVAAIDDELEDRLGGSVNSTSAALVHPVRTIVVMPMVKERFFIRFFLRRNSLPYSYLPLPLMKLFLDTANVESVAEIAAWGVLDGVTTNPSLVAKEKKDFKETVLAMCKLVPCVSAQVTAEDFEGMKKQGEEYASWHKHVVVKVPMTTEGLKALHYFKSKGIKTNTTLIFSAAQAVLAAKAGATIISPFIGRLDDAGEDGMGLIAEIMEIWANYNFDTEVLVASTRHPRHIVDAGRLGAHICTIPADVFKKLPFHPLTDSGIKKFQDDWKTVSQK